MDQSYIVRIYRNSCRSVTTFTEQELLGVVEDVDQGRSATFRNIEELWRFLALSQSTESQLDKIKH